MNISYKLINNEDESQYEFHVENFIPKIEYIKTDDGEIYLTHTEVPCQLEGRGIASSLVKRVLADIEMKGLRLVPLCPFIAGYIQKNPEWRRIIMKGIDVPQQETNNLNYG